MTDEWFEIASYDFDDEPESTAVRMEFKDHETGYFHKMFWENDQDYDGIAEVSPYYKPDTKITVLLGKVLPWAIIDGWMWSKFNVEIADYGLIEIWTAPTVEEVVKKAGDDLRVRVTLCNDDSSIDAKNAWKTRMGW